MIPIDSKDAAKLNVEVFKLIKEKAYAASTQMAAEYGEPEVLKGYGRRNSTLLAIAPTTSSAFILGQVSQGIEPVRSNCYVKDIAKIKVTIKNPFLEKLLEEK
jgi:ribonucleoside-diphosphate reductase alpha chain